MDLDIREWMLLAGGALFVLVVVDGVRRVLADRKEEVRLSKNAKKGVPAFGDESAPPRNSELVSGPRVVQRGDNEPSDKAPARQVAPVDETDVPVLLNPICDEEIDTYQNDTHESSEIGVSSAARKEPTIEQGVFDLTSPEVDTPPVTADITQAANLGENPSTINTAPLSEPRTDHDTTQSGTAMGNESPRDAVAAPEPAAQPPVEVEEVVVINVHAQKGEVFNGRAMLETLLNHDVRFGNMDIFHKRETLADSQRVQFSIVNAVEPGTFVLDEFDDFTTPGVTFFMQLPGPTKPMAAFKEMLAVANALSTSANGTMLDEQRNPISQQTLEHMKQQVEDFERRSLAKRPR